MKNLIQRILNKGGYEIRRIPTSLMRARPVPYDKIHYGCGSNYMTGWLNVDLGAPVFAPADQSYLRVDLTYRHPFLDEAFSFGFCEDFLEHLTQAQSLTFLTEAFRTLRKGGVLRLSFPSLEGVLKKHYTGEFEAARVATTEAYDMWGTCTSIAARA